MMLAIKKSTIRVGDHPPEDTFEVPAHPWDRPKVVTIKDDDDWNSPLPPHMIPKPAPKRAQSGGGLRIYLAGPMTGIKEFNFPAFNAAAKMLRSHGHEVFNPAERDIERHGIDISLGNANGDPAKAIEDHGFSLRDALADDTDYICRRANAIAMLPGWERSGGAQAEHRLAVALDHEILYLGGFFYA